MSRLISDLLIRYRAEMLKKLLFAITGLFTVLGVIMFMAGWNTAAQSRADELMAYGGGVALLCGLLFLMLLVKRAF